MPVPASVIVCGLPPALSYTKRTAFCTPVEFGVNVTLTVQLDPGVRPATQLFFWVNSLVPFPTMVILPNAMVAPPTFATVMFWGGLVVPTVWFPKFSAEGEKLSRLPVPESAISCGPGALS